MEEQKEMVRVMTREENAAYDDITIEEQVDEGSSRANASQRPTSFNEVYEDNSNRSNRQQNFRQNFRSYGGNRVRVRTFGFGSGMTAWQKWKYRIIAGIVVAGLLAFLFFVALPVVSVVIITAMIAYLLYNFFG